MFLPFLPFILAGIIGVQANLFHDTKQTFLRSYQPINLNENYITNALQIVQFSYCSSDRIKQFDCEDCDHWELYLHYEPTYSEQTRSRPFESSQVVIVADKKYQQLLVGFRGTQSNLSTWMDEIDITFEKWGRGKVNKEFYKQFMELQGKTFGAIELARSKYPHYPIIVAGHSTGGALAVMYTAMVMARFPLLYPSRVFTFGSPRFGDGNFANLLDSYGERLTRVMNQDDVMTELPLTGTAYRHVGKLMACNTGLSECVLGVQKEDRGEPILKTMMDLFRNEEETHWTYLGKKIKEYEC